MESDMATKPEKEDLYLTRKTLLMRACDQKDQQAWEEFVAYYRPFIGIILRYLYVKEHDIDDLSQTVIINLWKKLDSFDADRSKFRTWLSTVIRNAVTTFKIKDSKDRNRDNKYFEENTKLSDDELKEAGKVIATYVKQFGPQEDIDPTKPIKIDNE